MPPVPSGECTGPAEKWSAAQGKGWKIHEKEERKQRSNCDSSECIFLFFYKYPLKLMTIVKRTAIITGTVKSISGQGEVKRWKRAILQRRSEKRRVKGCRNGKPCWIPLLKRGRVSCARSTPEQARKGCDTSKARSCRPSQSMRPSDCHAEKWSAWYCSRLCGRAGISAEKGLPASDAHPGTV